MPADFLYGALRVTGSLAALITVLSMPRNGAFRVIQACVAVAAAVGTITFCTELGAAEQPLAAVLTQLRCSTASMVIEALRNLLSACWPTETAAAVFAAAAPPPQLVPLLHAAASTLLEALDAGALVWSPTLF
jgi:hypothetical protein